MSNLNWTTKTSKIRLVFTNILVFCLFFTIGFWSYRLGVHPESSYADTTANLDVNLNVQPILSLTISQSEITFNDVVAVAGGTFVSDSVIATVETNNSTGYNLTMSTIGAGTNQDEDNVKLNKSDGTTTHFINSITTDTTGLTAASFTTMNTWGYTKTLSPNVNAAADTAYHPIPPLSNPATLRTVNHVPVVDLTNTDSTKRTNEQETEVGIGIVVDPTLQAGTYQNTLVFTAVANSAP